MYARGAYGLRCRGEKGNFRSKRRCNYCWFRRRKRMRLNTHRGQWMVIISGTVTRFATQQLSNNRTTKAYTRMLDKRVTITIRTRTRARVRTVRIGCVTVSLVRVQGPMTAEDDKGNTVSRHPAMDSSDGLNICGPQGN
jgi:hypothetical protein